MGEDACSVVGRVKRRSCMSLGKDQTIIEEVFGVVSMKLDALGVEEEHCKEVRN